MIDIKDRILIHDYDATTYDFRKLFADHCQEMLGCSDLERLHEFVPEHLKLDRLVSVEDDQSTYLHKILYQIDPAFQSDSGIAHQTRDRGFIRTYRSFVQFLRESVFNEALVYQRLPTMRVHLPENLSVGEYHRDRDYYHPPEEINIWVPITQAEDTASIRIESAYGRGDHSPVNTRNGQYVIFDSALQHGNKVNVESYTRVSLDFRVIPFSQYHDTDLKSATQHMEFRIGDYYDLLS